MNTNTTADFRVLMQLAGDVGRAKKSGDADAIKIAQEAHDRYHELCLQSDQMILGCTHGAMDDIAQGQETLRL